MEIKNPTAPATPRQTWAIRVLGGGDVRNDNLTREQASAMIQRLQAEKTQKTQKTQKTTKPGKPGFDAVFAKAKAAAQKAGEKWLAQAEKDGPAYVVVDPARPLDPASPGRAVGTMLDLCGMAYVKIERKGTGFAKWLAKRDPQATAIRYIRFGIAMERRQELGLQEAIARAGLEVLSEAGITGLGFFSRVD